jgi:orotidine-5'-phosphate decarboxylase
MTSINPYERIIWSADVADGPTLMAYLEQMPKLRIIKIDRLFVTDAGLGVIDYLTGRGLLVFDDAKIIEIPSKAVGIAQKHLAHRPWMLNCMAGVLSSSIMTHEDREKVDGLKRFADACHQVDAKPCAVTVLTSKSARVVRDEFGGRFVTEQVLYYLDILLECGFTDVVCSPKEVAAIRAERRFDGLDLNTPGIRPASNGAGDQARTDTPQAAMLAGATRLVIGRPITQGNPADNLAKIVASIEDAVPTA